MKIEFKSKVVSSLEKCLYFDDYNSKSELRQISMLSNEKLNFQVVYTCESKDLIDKYNAYFELQVDEKLKKHINVYKIESVPIRFPSYFNVSDNDYISKNPGLYPDILEEYDKADNVYFVPESLQSIFIEIDLSKNEDLSGIFNIKCDFIRKGLGVVSSSSVEVEIIDQKLSDEEIKFTQWFHSDCLSSYYDLKPLSDEHFEVIKSFMVTAREYGINTILTPVLTPALDTEIGGERPTIQLVKIEKTGNVYSYNYDMLDRWIELCKEVGFTHFEISHFFTQWGAKHAPKVIAIVNGNETRIFGWDTNACDKEYVYFIRDFIKNLLQYLKTKGIDKQCIFHISDEPNESNIDSYKAASDIVSDLLSDYLVTDALSNIEFYKKRIVKTPIPATNHIELFVEEGINDLWTYYCCGQHYEVGNRFIAMPAYRNRILGVQFYKYNIKGFLHWGYNFYYNQLSRKLINPFYITDGDYFAPAGDAYSVYPGFNKKPLKSIRLLTFNEALQDLRAFKKLEELTSYEYVMQILEDNVPKISFSEYPRNNEYILNVRKIVNEQIKKRI